MRDNTVYFSDGVKRTFQYNGIVVEGVKTDVVGPVVGFLSHRGSTPSGIALPEAFEVMEHAIERGYVHKADTIEELAGVLFTETKPYVTFGGAKNGWALTSAHVGGQIIADILNGK